MIAQRPRTSAVKSHDAFTSGNRYCILAYYWAGNPKAQFFAIDGKIVVFDTIEIARDYAPQLAPGRLPYWDVTEEICYFSPLDPQGFNRVDVVTGYDPYNVPVGFGTDYGVFSEAKSMAWKYHAYRLDAHEALMAFGKQMERERMQRRAAMMIAAGVRPGV